MTSEALSSYADYSHVPVMLEEVMEYLQPEEGKRYVDGTFGKGGYSRALLDHTDCELICLDRDPDVAPLAQAFCEEQKKQNRSATFIAGDFGNMRSLLEAQGIDGVDGIMLDIGVSSMQLEVAERGFSFMQDGPLDMRMSQQGDDAATLINSASEEMIADVLYRYGGEKASRKIARKIVQMREEEPILRTRQLADLVRSVVRKKPSDKIDPATRTFQALRIWVNDELGELERVLEASLHVLRPGGRIVVVTFHSLEDGIVKQFFRQHSGWKEGVSRHIPVQNPREEEEQPVLEVVTRKAVKPSKSEIDQNPRARSAKLRAACKVAEFSLSKEGAS